uniref:Structural maintenance of chromosomes protein 6 n=1 Tax=Lygus hesperus TaxID=30085 RepID=A0A0A9Z5G2_LYGHE
MIQEMKDSLGRTQHSDEGRLSGEGSKDEAHTDAVKYENMDSDTKFVHYRSRKEAQMYPVLTLKDGIVSKDQEFGESVPYTGISVDGDTNTTLNTKTSVKDAAE